MTYLEFKDLLRSKCRVYSTFHKEGFYYLPTHNYMFSKELVEYFFERCNQSWSTSVYDYMYFLRKERAKLFPICTFKVKRRKTHWQLNSGDKSLFFFKKEFE